MSGVLLRLSTDYPQTVCDHWYGYFDATGVFLTRVLPASPSVVAVGSAVNHNGITAIAIP